MNTEKVSDTPRTDAEQEHVNNAFKDQICTVPAPDPYFVPVGFARQLERELRDWQRLQLWGGTPAVVEAFIKGQQNRIHTCQDLELELAEWKACAEKLAAGWRPHDDDCALHTVSLLRRQKGAVSCDCKQGAAFAEFDRLNQKSSP